MPQARRLDPYLALAVMALAVSWAAILIKLCRAPATAIAFWRLALAMLLVAPGALWTGGGVPLRRYGSALVAGFFLGLHLWTWIASLGLTTLASSMFLLTTQLILALLSSSLLLKEPPGRRVLAAVTLAVVGIVMIGGRHLTLEGHALTGDLLALASAALFVLYLLVGRRARQGIPVLPWLAVVYGAAAVTSGLAAASMGEPLLGHGARNWILFLALAVVPTIGGHGMANYAVRYVRVYVINLVVLAEPVLTLLWAFLLWRELPGQVEVVGGLLILAGGYLAIQEERRLQAAAG
jgi:drug/metabolite transporter (DMT)-like permease